MNKEEKKAYDKKRYQDNKEDKKERDKIYKGNNQETIKEYQKKYREENKEHNKFKASDPHAQKLSRIRDWKRNGVIDDLDFIHDNYYINETNCWVCKKEFVKNYDRCLDHDHSKTENNFRQILCRKCNTKDSWIKYSEIV